MQYALLAYGSPSNQDVARPIADAIADVLTRTYVTGWARLYAAESATTVRGNGDQTLLTDGPFIESKEFLAGIIMIEADDLDAALAVAQELQGTRSIVAIEVRPVREALFRGA